jgi:hypothetical protein
LGERDRLVLATACEKLGRLVQARVSLAEQHLLTGGVVRSRLNRNRLAHLLDRVQRLAWQCAGRRADGRRAAYGNGRQSGHGTRRPDRDLV